MPTFVAILLGLGIMMQIMFDLLVIDLNTQRVESDKRLCRMIQNADCSYFDFQPRKR